MGVKVGELFATIDIKGAGTAAGSVDGIVKAMTSAYAIVAALTVAFAKLSSEVRDFAMVLDRYEVITGKSADQLQRISYRATQLGVSLDTVAGTIQNLQKIKTDVLLGKGMPAAFMLLGIDPNEDPVEMLETLREKISKLDSALARNITQELGISDEMFYYLRQSNKEVEELNKKYIVTEKQRKTLVKLNAEWRKLWFYVKNIATQIAALSAVFQTRLVQVLTRALQMFADIVKLVYQWIDASPKLLTAIKIIGAALLIYFAPFYAVIAGIILILEDLWVAMNGGDSFLKDVYEWIKGFFDWAEVIKEIAGAVDFVKAAFESLGTVLKAQWELIKPFFEIPAKIAGMVAGSQEGMTGGLEMLDSIKQTGGNVLDLLGFNKIVSGSINAVTRQGNNTTENNVTVHVSGGETNSETGSAVAAAVIEAIGQSSATSTGSK